MPDDSSERVEPPPEPSILKLGKRAEAVAKLSAVAFAVVYAAGMVVLSMHTVAVGAPFPSFLRTDAVAAGLWWAVPWVFAGLLAYAPDAVEWGRSFARSRPDRRVVTLPLLVLASVGGMAVLVKRVVNLAPATVTPYAALSVAAMTILSAILVSVLVHSQRARSAKDKMTQGMHKIGLCIVITAELFSFANVRFRVIPQSLGGGAPEFIHLRFRGSAEDIPPKLFWPPAPSKRSRDLLLRYETEDALFVSVFGDAALYELPRDLIASVERHGRPLSSR